MTAIKTELYRSGLQFKKANYFISYLFRRDTGKLLPIFSLLNDHRKMSYRFACKDGVINLFSKDTINLANVYLLVYTFCYIY